MLVFSQPTYQNLNISGNKNSLIEDEDLKIYILKGIDFKDNLEYFNKNNEKRKSHTLFLVNLAKHGFIKKFDNIRLLKKLLENEFLKIWLINFGRRICI